MSTRCPTCDAPLMVRQDSTTYRPHLSWCRWTPRPRPPVIVLMAPTPDVVPVGDEDEFPTSTGRRNPAIADVSPRAAGPHREHA